MATPYHILQSEMVYFLISQGFKYGYRILEPNDQEQVLNILAFIEEDMTSEEYYAVRDFLVWVFEDYESRAFGSANYEYRVRQYAEAKRSVA